jgi:succinate dehydrogenase / fumarate reductase, membrane anchor subunit
MAGMIRIDPRTRGRARPSSSGLELFIWYAMRISGVALFVLALAHFTIIHFVFDVAGQSAEWIATQRWNQVLWRVFDWTLLMMVLFHSFMGTRTVVQDYVHRPRARLVTLSVLYLALIVLFVMGTSIVLTLPSPGAK